MAIVQENLILRTPILDRNQEIAFQRLEMAAATPEQIMPLMFHLSNVESPQATCFIPIGWTTDEVLRGKLSRSTVLVADSGALQSDSLLQKATASGYRIALAEDCQDAKNLPCDFRLTRFDGDLGLISPDIVLTRMQTAEHYLHSIDHAAMYFNGSITMLPQQQAAKNKHANPAQTVILELMAAVQHEASAKDIESIFKRDVALSFKLLRYINSPWFGLAVRVESVRHALSILGYQQLLKWLALLAVTAGQAASPAITQTAMIRARLLEVIGGRMLDRRDGDHLFMVGMLSLLDRIMGMPLPDILARANLPTAIIDALIQGEGKYRRFLDLALACEGLLDEASLESLPDVDVRMVNIAHMEAVEWAAQITATRLG